MEILKAILFGLVEGITEWLPISSTGHMILLDEFVKLDVSNEFYKLFEVVIQLGAIMAVVVMYFKELFPWGFGKTRKNTIKTFNLWGKIMVACFPAIIVGLLLDDWFDKHFYNAICVSIALILYGVIFIVIETIKKKKYKTKSIDDITYGQALAIGGFQCLAIIPGTSRSGSTIIGGLMMGIERSVISKFTFFLGVPVMAGASLLKLIKYILDVGFKFNGMELLILGVGTLVAFIVSIFIIKFLMNYIRKHDFKVFGYYRIILGIAVILYFLIIK